MHQHLRQRSEQAHARLHGLLPLLDSELTSRQLQNILRGLYGFYAPLELAMHATAQGGLRAEVRRRKKAEWLVQDLLTLGDTREAIGRLPICVDLPHVALRGQLLGALYVMEGATLGGQMIREAVQKNLGRHVSCRFFAGYGEGTPKMWNVFLRVLTEHTAQEDMETHVIPSACATFSSLERWLHLLSPTFSRHP